ncbi:MAG: hypothetical protein GXY15_04650 [Candidatus Hydrogenedentes bacterium]|nr:hypothetical protein [Candidatus Hydrogenedentota bacterium]
MKFLLLDAVYLLLVMGWTVVLPPMGRDYSLFGVPLPDMLLTWWRLPGGESLPAPVYHVVALLLLYLCMVLVFFLTRLATRGPWWLGSVAAVVFMAHPVKAEAALMLSGVTRELLFTAAALGGLLMHVARPRPLSFLRTAAWDMAAVGLLMVGAVGGLSIFAFGPGVLLLPFLWDALVVPRSERGGSRLARPLLVVLLTCSACVSLMWAGSYGRIPTPSEVLFFCAHPFAVMGLLLYPLGILPETRAVVLEYSEAAAAAFLAAGVIGLWAVHRLTNRTVLLGLLSVGLICLWDGVFYVLFPASPFEGFVKGSCPFPFYPVDPVHFANGGRLTLATAFMGIAAAGVFAALLRHPRWRKPAVALSTALCVGLMVLHGIVNLQWVSAGQRLREFRRTAEALAAQHPGETLVVAPDIGYAGFAPLSYAGSVSENTPFGRALDVRALAWCDVEYPAAKVTVTEYSPDGFAFTVTQPYPPDVRTAYAVEAASAPPAPPRVGLFDLRPRVFYAPKKAHAFSFQPADVPFPAVRIPLPGEAPPEKAAP